METLLILFIGVQLLFAVLLFFLTLAFIMGAPFVPSARNEAESMIELAGIKRGINVYDLGSGDGRILIMAARRGALATGFEINPFLVFLTMLRARLNGLGHLVKVRCMNFWHADIHDADIIFIYLIPWRMDRLKDKLLAELKPGATVVSNSFIFRNWRVFKSDPEHHIYVFRVTKALKRRRTLHTIYV